MDEPSKATATIRPGKRDRQASDLRSAGEVRILVVDDDRPMCAFIQEALTGTDFIIDAVSDPAEIEAGLKKQTYHLVILDYVIPGVDSGNLLGWVKDHQADAGVIVITGFPSIDSALNCLRAHIFDYLTKPFAVDQLQEVVTRCLVSMGLLRMSEDALREAVGQVIREQRKAKGLTLAQLADKANLSLGYLSQIELGKNSASIETLYRIALGLGTKLADLFQSVQLRS